MSDTTKFANRVPANRATAVTVGRGVHWEPAKKLVQPWDAWRDEPLPLLPLPPDTRGQPEADLTGFRVCRLTVLGYGGRGSGNARWVVRCTCGKYGHQKARFLRSDGAKARGMCPWCDYLEELKAGRVPPPESQKRDALTNDNPSGPKLGDLFPEALRRRNG